MTKKTKLTIFDDDYVRPWHLEYTGQVLVNGVKAFRYSPSNVTFLPNSDYAMQYQGFANMEQLYNGTPIFFSNPHYFGAPTRWLNRVLPTLLYSIIYLKKKQNNFNEFDRSEALYRMQAQM